MNWSFVGRDDCFCLFLPANFGPLWTNLKVFLFKMIHAVLTIIQASFHICISHCNVGQASSISSLCFSQTGIVHSIFLHLTIPSGVHETCGIYTCLQSTGLKILPYLNDCAPSCDQVVVDTISTVLYTRYKMFCILVQQLGFKVKTINLEAWNSTCIFD